MNNYSVFIECGKFGKQDFRSVRQYFCKGLLFSPFCQQESPATTLSVALWVRMRRSNGRSILRKCLTQFIEKLRYQYIFACCLSTILDYLRAIFVEGLAIASSNTSIFLLLLPPRLQKLSPVCILGYSKNIHSKYSSFGFFPGTKQELLNL